MSRYIVQRSAWVAVVLIGISVFTFALLHLTPGDPAQILLGPIATPQELARLHRELGLDRPLATQYVLWLAHVAQGDLGRSITLHRPVLGELLLRFRGTIILAAGAVIVAFGPGIALGVLAARRPGQLVDRLSMIVTVGGASIPPFWLGMILIILFSLRLGWLPGTGMSSPSGAATVGDVLTHLILPAFTLGALPLAIITRVARTGMIEALRGDYVRTARAKGLGEAAVTMRHAFRNTLVGIVTVVGLEMGFLLAGAVYVETVFDWPGVGLMLVNAILTRDFPLVQGAVLLVATTYVIINLVTDLFYAYLDPRIRFE
ncbi:MAG TPA: ABC transporter permease [bacterium]|nr:ABC transporter permease [bacterium]